MIVSEACQGFGLGFLHNTGYYVVQYKEISSLREENVTPQTLLGSGVLVYLLVSLIIIYIAKIIIKYVNINAKFTCFEMVWIIFTSTVVHVLKYNKSNVIVV